jgi:hypothetical protein
LTIGSDHAMIDSDMQGEVTYRQLVLRDGDEEKIRLPLVAPVNDLLGWLRPDTSGYVSWLSNRYPGLRGLSSFSAGQAFLAAAKKAVRGQLSADVAHYVERLRFASDGMLDDVPDFPALAAWSLLEAIRRQSLKLRTCPLCEGKWLGPPNGSDYCQRVAPGHGTKDCRTFDYERRQAGDSRYRAYRREYKRLTEQQRRGSLDVRELIRWREENGPSNWRPFDEWKARAERAQKED